MFDLVYTDAQHKDQGVVKAYSFDVAWGSDENDFQLVLPATESLDFGALVYVDGTQIGGVIDDKAPDGTGSVKTITYHGRTWHGILLYSVIQPDAGADYYTYSGDANDVIRAIITRQGLQDIFECVGNSGITVSGRFDRYTDAYSGLLKMLTRDSNKRGKLHFEKKPGGKVALQAVEVATYTSELDSDRYGFKSKLDARPINHLICLGEGDLKDRVVVHFFADIHGNVSQTQTQFGINERCIKYDANNSDRDEIMKSGREKLEDLQKTSSIDMTLMEDAGTFEIGDIVGSLDNLSGVYVESTVSKVIAKVNEKGIATYSYEVGDIQTSKSASGGGVSMNTLEAGFVKKSGDTMSGTLFVERNASGDTGVTVKRTDKSRDMLFGIGNGGDNRGIYDHQQGKWVFHVNASNQAFVNEQRVIHAEKTGDYWGIKNPDASSEGWIRTPQSGLLPYSDNATSGNGSVGTAHWPFAGVYSMAFRRGAGVAGQYFPLGGNYQALFTGKSLAKGNSVTYDIAASNFVLFFVQVASGALCLGIRSGTRLDFVGAQGDGSNSYQAQGRITFSNSYKTATVTDCSYYKIGTWTITANTVKALYGIL